MDEGEQGRKEGRYVGREIVRSTYTCIGSGKGLLITTALAGAFPERRHQCVQGRSSLCLRGEQSSNTGQHSQGRHCWSRNYSSVMEA